MRIVHLKIMLTWCLLCAGSIQVHAWNDTGHMVVAQVAWKHLTPQAKTEADRLVSLLASFYPNSNSFVTAACWPDDIARAGLQAFGHWHYIGLPYDPDKILTPAEVGVIVAASKDNNVKWAIGQCVDTLQDKDAKDFEKAFMLRMLLHCVADVHQPLHCATLYNSHFPEGDRGGNLYQLQGHAKNLHHYWDTCAGLFEEVSRPLNGSDQAYIERLAQLAMVHHPLSKDEFIDGRPAVWALESFQLAVKSAYAIHVGGRPSSEYANVVRNICLERAALAGYRLAFLLNELFSR